MIESTADHCPVCLQPIGSDLVDIFAITEADGSSFLTQMHAACADAVLTCRACDRGFAQREQRFLRRRNGRLFAWHVAHQPADVEQAP